MSENPSTPFKYGDFAHWLLVGASIVEGDPEGKEIEIPYQKLKAYILEAMRLHKSMYAVPGDPGDDLEDVDDDDRLREQFAAMLESLEEEYRNFPRDKE